ncbi:unnamed protein product [Ilex paraguariensis]|uniref:Uncharacterized protein n=1 Tax=Ilex paraguariensis TaxID=185542 RepID=A0ABC8TL14_9AQUA
MQLSLSHLKFLYLSDARHYLLLTAYPTSLIPSLTLRLPDSFSTSVSLSLPLYNTLPLILLFQNPIPTPPLSSLLTNDLSHGGGTINTNERKHKKKICTWLN